MPDKFSGVESLPALKRGRTRWGRYSKKRAVLYERPFYSL